MSSNYLPKFKKSGDGLAKDLKKLKKIELLTEGWYKGKFTRLMSELAGYTTVNGVRCYNYTVPVNGYTNTSDTSDVAKKTREFLKLLGVDEDKFDEIYDAWSSGQIESISIQWKKNYDFSSDDFEYTLSILYDNIKDVAKIVIVHDNAVYGFDSEGDVPATIARTCSSYINGNAWIQELFDSEPRDYGANYVMDKSTMTVYDSNDNDITSTLDIYTYEALKCLIVCSGSSFTNLISLTKVSEVSIPNAYIVTSREEYGVDFNTSFKTEGYDTYKDRGYISDSTDTNQEPTYVEDSYGLAIAINFWMLSIHQGINSNNADGTNLFYQKSYTIFGKTVSTGSIYMTVEGLKNTSSKNLSYYLSDYVDLTIQQKKKKRSFLGIGGFLGNFLGGIFEALVTIVGKIANLLYYIPIIRVQIQAIAWMFSGKWSNDRQRFKQAATSILIAIAAVVIIVLTGGASWQIAISLLTSAYNLYNSLDKYDDLKKISDANAYLETDDTFTEFEKLVDLSDTNNTMTGNYDYDPYGQIDSIYKSPFDSGGHYNNYN